MTACWHRNFQLTESVALDDRGLQYGDGLFETVAVRAGKPRLLRYHHERLIRGGDVLGLSILSMTDLTAQIDSALLAHDEKLDDCTVKIVITAGTGERGYARAKVTEPNVFIGVFPSRALPTVAYKDGVTARLCKTRLASGSVFAGLKTLNRLEQVLARSELSKSDDFEGLTMDVDGHIICGTMSNVFFVIDNQLLTPPLDRCGVEGVMRRHIFDVANDSDLDIELAPIHESMLAGVDEVFISNSQIGVVPVRQCGTFRKGAGEQTRRLMALLAASGISECRI